MTIKPKTMKNSSLLLCLIFLPFTLISQIHTSVDIIANYGLIYNSSPNFGVNNSFDRRFNFRIGGNFNFRIFDKKYIKTGIRYVRQGLEYTKGFSQNNSTSNDYADEYYLEIPLLFRVEFSERKLSFYTEVGGSPHFYLKGKYTTRIGISETVEDFDQPYLVGKRVRMALVVGLGFNIKISKQYQFFMQSTYVQFRPIEFGFFQKAKTRSLGIEFGFRRAINFVDDRT